VGLLLVDDRRSFGRYRMAAEKRLGVSGKVLAARAVSEKRRKAVFNSKKGG